MSKLEVHFFNVKIAKFEKFWKFFVAWDPWKFFVVWIPWKFCVAWMSIFLGWSI